MTETEQTINRKIAAAQILGLGIEKTYRYIGDSFFLVLTVKPKERIFTLELNKDQQLSILEDQKSLITTQITAIDDEIDKIKKTTK